MKFVVLDGFLIRLNFGVWDFGDLFCFCLFGVELFDFGCFGFGVLWVILVLLGGNLRCLGLV